MKAVITTFMLLTFSVAHAEGFQRPTCDDYIHKFGGPCLDGVDGKSVTGTLPVASRTVMGFTMGDKTFDDANKILGDAQRWHTGDAAASEEKICYFSKKGSENVTLVLAQNSEMGSAIDDMRLIGGSVSFQNQCKELKAAPSAFRTASGIRIGMTEKELRVILGKPSGSKDGMLVYYWAESSENAPKDFCIYNGKSMAARGSGIAARFINGRLDWINIGLDSGWQC
ncbi:MAG: hypothetical protein CAF41_012950 [Nitrospira sp. CG24A]|nr:MAG: hypothetical protein CAF41_012950 [Nitrospira sp. CG24A]